MRVSKFLIISALLGLAVVAFVLVNRQGQSLTSQYIKNHIHENLADLKILQINETNEAYVDFFASVNSAAIDKLISEKSLKEISIIEASEDIFRRCSYFKSIHSQTGWLQTTAETSVISSIMLFPDESLVIGRIRFPDNAGDPP